MLADMPWGKLAFDLFGFCIGAAIWVGADWFCWACSQTKPKPEPFNKRRRRY